MLLAAPGLSYLTPPVDGLQMGVTSASSHTVATTRCCLLRWPFCWRASCRASSFLCGSLWQVRPLLKLIPTGNTTLGIAAPDADCSTELHEGGAPIVFSQLPLAAPALESQIAPTMVQQLPAVSLALSIPSPRAALGTHLHVNVQVTTLMQS